MGDESPKFSLFEVGQENGFLPKEAPLSELPAKYFVLERILHELPAIKKNGAPGLLGEFKMAEAIENFPLLDVSEEGDVVVLAALFRDYCFLASAYIFEPCYQDLLRTGSYNLAREVLPATLAIPLTQLARRLGVRPFMDYAHAYILNNWRKKDPSQGLSMENLEPIRTFTGDSMEDGFIQVHVAMNFLSPKLIANAIGFLAAVRQRNKTTCVLAMKNILEAMKQVQIEMKKMWTISGHAGYHNFRTFIFGIKDQPVLPNGLIYEGVFPQPQFHRGISGANDSLIPLIDNLLEITRKMPENDLTSILRDFRTYRPSAHEEFLIWTEKESAALSARAFATEANPILLIQLLDQVREFRMRHWNFVKVFILKDSNYPVATGGSPIIHWLPNEMTTVLHDIIRTVRSLPQNSLTHDEIEYSQNLSKKCEAHLKSLEEQVKGFDADFKSARKHYCCPMFN